MLTLQLALALSLTCGAPSSAPSAPAVYRHALIPMPGSAFLKDSSKIFTAELKALIDSGLSMLREERHVEFLERFISPKQKEDILGETTVEQLAETFKVEKAKILRAVLTEIRGKKPALRMDESLATYKLRRKLSGRGVIEFTRIDGVWYIRN